MSNVQSQKEEEKNEKYEEPQKIKHLEEKEKLMWKGNIWEGKRPTKPIDKENRKPLSDKILNSRPIEEINPSACIIRE